ncbi:glycosyltransferase family 4 protein [Microcoleus sp. LEGE 07076]|uniref:glycosyltransferase family 4 protein n=1 Tax=Microcoleus sp. LEGE 07076 TaxID=915322 RepID=UPI0018805F4D|nr:glycosyltransferase family 4 protein [Microcoleus sp. LEGE 07076]MBE9186691.1 glycosyltransferase family 4 protein [Microcoleus sp. LEGE 07076]
MKITFVLPTLCLTGGIRVVSIFAELLRKRGHEVFVISVPHAPPILRQQVKSLLRGRGLISAPKNEPSFFDNLGVKHEITDRYRPVEDKDVPDADVVVATWWETAEWVAKLSPSKGAKAYFIQHHEVFDYIPEGRVEATWMLPMHKITISQWLVDLARTKYKDDQVSLAPPSVDTKQFYACPRHKQSVPTIGMMYSTIYWKGTDIALKAFSLAAEKIPNLRLVAFGTQAPSSELPLPTNAEYVIQPDQDQIKDYYSKCDAWLLASRSEGFGLPIIEAMACRTPVISTPAGAAPEILSGGSGILVQPEDPEEMAEAIQYVCQLPDAQWRALSEAAYAKVVNYTWEDATTYFEAGLKVAVDKSKQRDFKIFSCSPYYVPDDMPQKDNPEKVPVEC